MIHIIDNFYIDANHYDYILKQKCGKLTDESKDEYGVVGYYRSMEHALGAIIKKKQLNAIIASDMTLEEGLQALRDINNRTEELLSIVNDKVTPDGV